jgi:Cdc6-like AAA superfamily ATPase
VIAAVSQRGQHVILFGERGVGKTSLANVLAELLGQAGIHGLKSGTINCDGTDTFSSLWHKAFREISFAQRVRGIGFSAAESSGAVSLDTLLPDTVTPDDVRYALAAWGQRTIIIIDELDRLPSGNVTTLLADTIKNLSDHSIDTTFILVGVADSVNDLIAEHQSVERALVQVQMPRMSDTELLEIIDKGMAQVNLGVHPSARIQIAALSQGLPHFTHLLALHAAESAIEHERAAIAVTDVENAIRKALDKAQQSIRSAYHKATSSPRKDNLFGRVLLSCALANTDELGYFAAADVREPLSRIMGKPVEIPAYSQHLNDFCEESRGRVLQKTGSVRKFRFRFVNPLMQPYVVLHGLANNLVPEDLLAEQSPRPSSAAATRRLKAARRDR